MHDNISWVVLSSLHIYITFTGYSVSLTELPECIHMWQHGVNQKMRLGFSRNILQWLCGLRVGQWTLWKRHSDNSVGYLHLKGGIQCKCQQVAGYASRSICWCKHNGQLCKWSGQVGKPFTNSHLPRTALYVGKYVQIQALPLVAHGCMLKMEKLSYFSCWKYICNTTFVCLSVCLHNFFKYIFPNQSCSVFLAFLTFFHETCESVGKSHMFILNWTLFWLSCSPQYYI